MYLMPSEKETSHEKTARPSLIEDFASVIERSERETPASSEDFEATYKLFDEIIAQHHYRNRYPEHRLVNSSVFLRQADEADTAPRIRVVTDPQGEMNDNTNFAGLPTIKISIEQGVKAEYEPLKGKPGSWGLGVEFIDREGAIIVTTSGGVNDGRGRRSGFEFNNPHPQPVSKELLEWVQAQLDDVETLVPAPTKSETRSKRLLGMFGFR